MRSKSIVLLLLALACGLVASIGISQVMERRKRASAAPESEPVIVAAVRPELQRPADSRKAAGRRMAQG